jgi:hypothetical protein
MSDANESSSHRTPTSQLTRAWAHLKSELEDGLVHGFFECEITCEITTGSKRELVIRAGKSHKFTIPAEEINALTRR